LIQCFVFEFDVVDQHQIVAALINSGQQVRNDVLINFTQAVVAQCGARQQVFQHKQIVDQQYFFTVLLIVS
jgi:hypothetical protein